MTWAAAVALLFVTAALAADEPVSCEKLWKRYQRNCATPTPTAAATPSPSPKATASPPPLPCEPIGGVKAFAVGQDRMFCFTAPAGSSFVTIEATTPANTGCAYFVLELTEPNGHKKMVDGASYPMIGSEGQRVVGGRYYLWVSPRWISDARGCDIYQMTVR